MEFSDIFTEWEAEYDIFNRGVIDGFAFYAYMRREFVNEIYDSLSGIDRNLLMEGKRESSVSVFKKLLRNRKKIDKKEPSLLILNHSRRNLVDGKYECPFTDFLVEGFEDAVYLERPNEKHEHLSPAVTKNLYFIDRYQLNAYIYRVINKVLFSAKYKAVRENIKNIMDKPLEDLESRIGGKVRKNAYYDRCVILYYYYFSKKPAYLKLLKSVKPKGIAHVVGGSFDTCLMNELGKELLIPTIELQHCLLSVSAKFPKGVKVPQFADYFLTYSDYWKEFASFPIADDKVIACGSANFEASRDKYIGMRTKSDKRRIIFLSGPGYGHELSLVAVKLKELAGDEIEITYKLHPAEFATWKEDYKELSESGIKVVDTKAIGLYECFAKADAQIGVFSTTIYEGLGFSLDTYILNIPYAGDFIEFCHKGYGTLVDNADMLYQALTKKDNALTEVDNLDISSWFWKENAKENVIDTIRSIIG